MKTLILVLSLIIFTFSINAQGRSSTLYVDALKRDKNMERIGTALTIIGGVALFTGNILYWKIYNDSGNNEPQKDKVKRYGDIMIGGIGLMAVGIPLWAIGKSKERHIQIEAELVKFKGLASANGIGLKIRF
ncbi:MAG: hypothetical protein ABR927_06875 [Bacteroidales bacterium]|jgi:hypothetical protein